KVQSSNAQAQCGQGRIPAGGQRRGEQQDTRHPIPNHDDTSGCGYAPALLREAVAQPSPPRRAGRRPGPKANPQASPPPKRQSQSEASSENRESANLDQVEIQPKNEDEKHVSFAGVAQC